MKIKVVPAEGITSKSLRASDYVVVGTQVADRVIDQWLDESGLRGVLRRDSAAMKLLRKRIAQAVEEVGNQPTE